jgi:Cu2+-exporting ATPase/Cu+-exporting ATPase
MQATSTSTTVDFSFLDLEEFKRKYASGSERNQIHFYVEGIHCSRCVRKLEDLPFTTRGLKKLSVEIGRNLAHAELDLDQLRFSELAEKIARLGFRPIPLSEEVSVAQIEQVENRSEMIRLAVAAACAANIMIFSFATYFGADASLAPLFSILSFILYLPVVSYVALPFYRGAWSSLRQRQLSVDLPMAVASLLGFIFSTVELLRGRSDIYFDSLSGFLFLILVARWIQRRLQRRFLNSQELVGSFQLGRARLVNGSGWTWATMESLKAGDRILLQALETLPAEAELVSGGASFNLAWLSGESKPKAFTLGSTVPAGAQMVSSQAYLTVKKNLAATAFGQILDEVQRSNLSNNRIVSRADRWSQYLLMTVFSTAIIFVLAAYPFLGEEAIRRALALVILACPCAMAFGAPLGLAAALRKAQKQGLVVRNANVFENVLSTQTVFFDKTGTLTETDLELSTSIEDIPLVFRKIILGLENVSMHPIAFAFRRDLSTNYAIDIVDGAREVPGVGVSGYAFGRYYELRQQRVATEAVSCTLFEDSRPVMDFHFRSRLKPEVRPTLDQLRARGLRVVILSGDQASVVEPLARELGFSLNDTYHSLDPQTKAFLVTREQKAMVVGDGINDSLALLKAHVGVAVSGGVEAALRSSDVYLTQPGLAGISQLFEVSEGTVSLIKQNLAISVIYNALGGTLALMGFVNPFVAAVLMPISSGFILLSTWLRSRE